MHSSFLGWTLRPIVWALSPRGPPSRPTVPAHGAPCCPGPSLYLHLPWMAPLTPGSTPKQKQNPSFLQPGSNLAPHSWPFLLRLYPKSEQGEETASQATLPNPVGSPQALQRLPWKPELKSDPWQSLGLLTFLPRPHGRKAACPLLSPGPASRGPGKAGQTAWYSLHPGLTVRAAPHRRCPPVVCFGLGKGLIWPEASLGPGGRGGLGRPRGPLLEVGGWELHLGGWLRP